MLNPQNLSHITLKRVSEILPGDVLVNLGEVLELEEMTDCYSIIIARMGEKQIHKFSKDVNLAIL